MDVKRICAVAVVLFGAAAMSWAADKSYQVTGPVVELTDTKIVVMKDESRWEISRTEETKVETDLQSVNFRYLEENIPTYTRERQRRSMEGRR